jgi:hypothetical protein
MRSGADRHATQTRKETHTGQSGGGGEADREDFNARNKRVVADGIIDAGDFIVLDFHDARLCPTEMRTRASPSAEGDNKCGKRSGAKPEGEDRSGRFHGKENARPDVFGLLRRTACRYACGA